jgi:hypothetical protein
MVGTVPAAPSAAVLNMRQVQANDSGVVAELDSGVKASEWTTHGKQMPVSPGPYPPPGATTSKRAAAPLGYSCASIVVTGAWVTRATRLARPS